MRAAPTRAAQRDKDGCRIDVNLVAMYSYQAAPDFVKAAFKQER